MGKHKKRSGAKATSQHPQQQHHKQQQAFNSNHQQQEQQTDLYQVLGVERSCSQDDIKRAYRSRALRCHPDKNPSPEAQEEFKAISQAYSILSDPSKKAYYDKHGQDGLDMIDVPAEEFVAMFQDLFAEVLGGAAGIKAMFRGMSKREISHLPPFPFPKELFPPGTFPAGMKFSTAGLSDLPPSVEELLSQGGLDQMAGYIGSTATPSATGTSGSGSRRAPPPQAGRSQQQQHSRPGWVKAKMHGRPSRTAHTSMPFFSPDMYPPPGYSADGLDDFDFMGDDLELFNELLFGPGSEGMGAAMAGMGMGMGMREGMGMGMGMGEGMFSAREAAALADMLGQHAAVGGHSGSSSESDWETEDEVEDNDTADDKAVPSQLGRATGPCNFEARHLRSGSMAKHTAQPQTSIAGERLCDVLPDDGVSEAESSSSSPAISMQQAVQPVYHTAADAIPHKQLPASLVRDWISAAKQGELGVMRAMLANEPLLLDVRGPGLGHTALHWCAARGHVGCMQYLLQGADLNARNHEGSTPLHAAARNGQQESVHMLLGQAGLDIAAVDDDGCTAEEVAVQYKHGGIAALLVQASSKLRPTGTGQSYVHSGRGSQGAADQSVQASTSNAAAAMTQAASTNTGHVGDCSATQGSAGFAAADLDRTVKQATVGAFRLPEGGMASAVGAASGCEVTSSRSGLSPSSPGTPPLHEPAGSSHLVRVSSTQAVQADMNTELPVESGQEVHEVPVHQWSPLDHSTGDITGHNDRSIEGQTSAPSPASNMQPVPTSTPVQHQQLLPQQQQCQPPQSAAASAHSARAAAARAERRAELLAAEAEAEAREEEQEQARVQASAAAAAAVGVVPDQGRAWLQAAQMGELQQLTQLLAACPAVLHYQGQGTSLSFTGHTALHWAAAKGQVGCVLWLLCQGAKADRRNNAGGTPLHAAVAHKQLRCAQVLLLQGHASPQAADDLGDTARDLALRQGSEATQVLQCLDLLPRVLTLAHSPDSTWGARLMRQVLALAQVDARGAVERCDLVAEVRKVVCRVYLEAGCSMPVCSMPAQQPASETGGVAAHGGTILTEADASVAVHPTGTSKATLDNMEAHVKHIPGACEQQGCAAQCQPPEDDAEVHQHLGSSQPPQQTQQQGAMQQPSAADSLSEMSSASTSHTPAGVAIGSASSKGKPSQQEEQSADEDDLVGRDVNQQIETARLRGNKAFAAGDYHKAISHYTMAIRLSAGPCPVLYSNRAAAYAAISHFVKSLEDADTAVRQDPSMAKAHSRRGAALMGSRRYADAVKAYQDALRLDPAYTAAREGLQQAKEGLRN